MKVALLGPKGTYTHQAAKEYFDDFEPVFKSSITEVINAKESTKLVPVENSLQGSVMETIDLLGDINGKIVGEQVIKINHCLLSNEDSIKDIDKVLSHPQALAQSKNFIEENKLETVETNSTANATTNLKEKEAALASEIAGEIEDLNVLQKGVQDNQLNLTRFLVISEEETSEEGDKTSIIIEPDEDRPGILANILSCFSGHGINLTYIQSRPTKEGLGTYFFYIEAEAAIADRKMEKAVNCSNTYAKTKLLGSYKTSKEE